ncbi:MAG: cell surface protein [Candidatus Nealsonbacteria bacterium CG02_land_8_20_14_3_00_37_10]|uniref:Cell surface protein n=1 Tax=Candidatus Nealsonbacteria bacterium CG02_land_8_20_14_3_00_37_10 TaxID=1974699 RepID=A0A2M7D9A4_9BACT|nr:MAG: cell surface protein [Candidatus Nealsonbacteria bacterium CG02_land_8_20_14_3_00_37_10]
MEIGLQKYLGNAVEVLNQLKIVPKKDEAYGLASLLEEVKDVDEPKVLAIARVVQYMGTFNELVRDNVEAINFSDRYGDITRMFDSIRDDSKGLVEQLEDGRIDGKEKLRNFFMRITRGTPHNRFTKIRDMYLDVAKDTKNSIEKERKIMEAYVDFRFAVKNAEILAYEIMNTEQDNLKKAKEKWDDATKKVNSYKGEDNAELSKLQLESDEARRAYQLEDKRYQLIKDVSENLTVGYNVGETLTAKLSQTHEVKKRLYSKAITFFTTNEHVFTLLDVIYTSQGNLHEATQTLEAMQKGASKGIEDIADLGVQLEKEALKAGYGPTINKDSVQKLVDAIVNYQIESIDIIEKLRKESTENAKEIEMIVNEGKRKYKEAIDNYISKSN